MEEQLLEIYVSKDYDPYKNLAMEKYLCGLCGKNKLILYLWQNENTVIIGRNQNVYEQCNMDFIKENNIKIARRLSGGGAVYHDLGNLNYTIIGNEKIVSKDEHMKIIIDSIRSFGVDAAASGRNDIVASGKKISGTAYFSSDGVVCQHGCIMVNTNQEMMYRALRVKKDKFASKNICSVYARTVNLCELCLDIDVYKLSEQCIQLFCKRYPNYINVDINGIYEDNYYKLLLEKFSGAEWNIKEKTNSKIDIYGRLSFGDCSIVFDVEEGVIKKTKLYTDSLLVEPILEVQEILSNIPFKKNSIINALKKYRGTNDICSDLIQLIQKKMGD